MFFTNTTIISQLPSLAAKMAVTVVEDTATYWCKYVCTPRRKFSLSVSLDLCLSHSHSLSLALSHSLSLPVSPSLRPSTSPFPRLSRPLSSSLSSPLSFSSLCEPTTSRLSRPAREVRLFSSPGEAGLVCMSSNADGLVIYYAN